MKYIIVLPDGAADEPVPQLAGRTPLEVAKTPNMDWVSSHGVQGRVVTVPEGFTAGTDVATLSLLGYNPTTYYTGRAPLEAIAKGLVVRPDQIIFRCNFVTITDGRMKDFTAGHIAQTEADALIAYLNQHLADRGCDFFSGVSYRNLMLLANAQDMFIKCAPPHDIADQHVAEHWPKGEGAERAMEIMQWGAELLKEHPVNQQRAAQAKDLVTNIWLWGQGKPTKLDSFESRFGLKGALITGVDILRGIGLGAGLKLIEVPGATGYIDTDYAGKGSAAVKALEDFDLVVVHIEAADEAGHLGNADEKVLALERIDEMVVGPLLEAVCRHQEWRILIAPDHPTPIVTKAHSPVPPPFCYAGHDIQQQSGKNFSELSAKECGLFIEQGHELIRDFLGE